MARSALIRDSGQGHSVVTALTKDKAKWFKRAGESLQLSPLGLAALAREGHARQPALDEDTLVARLRPLVANRPRVKRELDQVHATLPSVARRARWLVARGHVQRGLLFFGDDDLAALAVHLLLADAGDERPVTVLDVDEEILAFYEDNEGIRTIHHDLREPLPRAYRGKFGAVFTDPPYAPAGFGLFASRAVSALKSDGFFLLQYGFSRRALERGLAKQRLLAEIGWAIEEMVPAFTEYEGAESIGANSTLVVASRTPQTRPLPESAFEGALYTRVES